MDNASWLSAALPGFAGEAEPELKGMGEVCEDLELRAAGSSGLFSQHSPGSWCLSQGRHCLHLPVQSFPSFIPKGC